MKLTEEKSYLEPFYAKTLLTIFYAASIFFWGQKEKQEKLQEKVN